MSDRPTILFYEPNDFRFYGAAQVLLWLMQHMQAVRPVFVAPGDGVLTQRVRAQHGACRVGDARRPRSASPAPAVEAGPPPGRRWPGTLASLGAALLLAAE